MRQAEASAYVSMRQTDRPSLCACLICLIGRCVSAGALLVLYWYKSTNTYVPATEREAGCDEHGLARGNEGRLRILRRNAAAPKLALVLPSMSACEYERNINVYIYVHVKV